SSVSYTSSHGYDVDFDYLLHPLFLHHLFFYLYRCHRDLHSFPTRRSSDLIAARWCRTVHDDAFRQETAAAARATCRMRSDWRGRDRKSTRLNSSHVKISYAVFCLKKKKKE